MTASADSQRGVALIIGLLMLLIITLLGIAMYKSVSLDEKVAGNLREKQRSFQAAESALRYAEWWLSQHGGETGTDCHGTVVVDSPSKMAACATPLATADTLPWPDKFDYQPKGMSVDARGGLTAPDADGVQDVQYQAAPSVHVYYKGLSADGKSMLYQVTSVGYGGAPNAATVLQSTYALQSDAKALDAP